MAMTTWKVPARNGSRCVCTRDLKTSQVSSLPSQLRGSAERDQGQATDLLIVLCSSEDRGMIVENAVLIPRDSPKKALALMALISARLCE